MAAKTKKPERVPVRRATEVVLLNHGKPMHYREISRKAIEQGIIKLPKGKRKADPTKTETTVRSFLCAEEGDKFVRVGPGVFDLSPTARKALKAAEKAKQKAGA
jgi:hypothetical protein